MLRGLLRASIILALWPVVALIVWPLMVRSAWCGIGFGIRLVPPGELGRDVVCFGLIILAGGHLLLDVSL